MAENDSRQALSTFLLERFGIPLTVLDDYLLFERKKGWFIMRKSEQVKNVAHLKVSRVGLRAFRRVGQFLKPTTRFVQFFGRFATKNMFHPDMEQLRTLILTGEIPVDASLEKGYVILTLGDHRILGLGLYIHGAIRSQFPRKEIRENMLE